MDYKYLIGYVNENGRYEQTPIVATAENVASFITATADKEDVTITSPFDTPFITARYGFIDKCIDQQFLTFELLPVLIPMQQGKIEPRPVEIFNEILCFDENACDEYESEEDLEF